MRLDQACEWGTCSLYPKASSSGSKSKEAVAASAGCSALLKDLTPEKQLYWQEFAERTINANVKLIPEPMTQTQVADAITDWATHSGAREALRGTGGHTYFMAIFDVKQTGEPITRPHIRIAPLQAEKAAKLLGGFRQSRAGLEVGSTAIINGDMVVLLDGGRAGLIMTRADKASFLARSVCDRALPFTYLLVVSPPPTPMPLSLPPCHPPAPPPLDPHPPTHPPIHPPTRPPIANRAARLPPSVHPPTHTHPHPHRHPTHTHTDTRRPRRPHPHPHVHAHARARKNESTTHKSMHASARKHASMQSRTQARKHARKHARRRTHARAQTQAHTLTSNCLIQFRIHSLLQSFIASVLPVTTPVLPYSLVFYSAPFGCLK